MGRQLGVAQIVGESLIAFRGRVKTNTGCIREDVSDSHLGHTENGHKKAVPRIRFVNHIKSLL